MKDHLRPALTFLVALSVLTGVLYPLVVTGIARSVFPEKAAGSLIRSFGDRPTGSRLIGQSFTSVGYFWGRLSATAPVPYNAAASGGSNLGPLNKALTENATARIAALREADPGNQAPVPVDLVTSSASGLDPHISLAAARYQAGRVARARGLAIDRVENLIAQATTTPAFGLFGEPVVNVLELNLALDALGAGSR